MPRLLLVPHGKIAQNLAGPGLRALGIARGLSPDVECAFWAPEAEGNELAGFAVEKSSDAAALSKAYDYALVPTLGAMVFEPLPRLTIPVVADLYDPVFFENLFLYRGDVPKEREFQLWRHQVALYETVLNADAFLSCHKRQSDYWTGMLTTLGALGFPEFDADQAFASSMIDLPTGLDIPEKSDPQAARQFMGEIPPDRKVLLWGGGIYPWLDPFTPLRALKKLKDQGRDEFSLLFMGVKHPEGSLAADLVKRTRSEAAALGLGPQDVHFNEWTPYEKRFDVAAASWAALIAHGEHVETRYAFRTRALDALAAGLPLITAAGDFFAALVEHEEAGAVFPCGEADALAAHICNLADRPAVYDNAKQRSKALGRKFSWRKVCSDLREGLTSGTVKRLKPGARQRQVQEHMLKLSIGESTLEKLARKAEKKGKDLFKS